MIRTAHQKMHTDGSISTLIYSTVLEPTDRLHRNEHDLLIDDVDGDKSFLNSNEGDHGNTHAKIDIPLKHIVSKEYQYGTTSLIIFKILLLLSLINGTQCNGTDTISIYNHTPNLSVDVSKREFHNNKNIGDSTKKIIEITHIEKSQSHIRRREQQDNIITDANIKIAAYLWVTNEQTALDEYGEIHFWNTSRVTNMDNLFGYLNPHSVYLRQYGPYSFDWAETIPRWNRNFNADLSRWDTRRVTSAVSMFERALSFNSDISTWNTSQLTNMNRMFYSASAFDMNMTSWNTTQVTSMSETFYAASAFNSDISEWDTSHVTSVVSMFARASSFNSDISAWDTGHITSVVSMFEEASSFNSDISRWNTSQVKDMNRMFYSASAFDIDLSTWNTGQVSSLLSGI